MHYKYAKGLIGALAVSGFLNIILLTSFFYWQVKERSPALYCEQKPALKLNKQNPIAVEESSSSLILRLQSLSYEQLFSKLQSPTPVENGYTERDLALACLTAFHHFDLLRALKGTNYTPQERIITYGQLSNGFKASIKVYSGLSNNHFAAITAFAFSERWPHTPKGLFLLLQKNKENFDSTLLDALLLTPEFIAIESLFKRVEPIVNKMEIVNFLLEGDWPMLAQFYEQQRLYGDLSDSRRQNILLDYIQKGSATAAILLLKLHSNFALKKLEDQQVLSLMTLLTQKSIENESFAKALLTSPRSDAVLQMAARRLYEFAGEKAPDNPNLASVLMRFAPEATQYPPKDNEKSPAVSKIKNLEKSHRYISAVPQKPTKLSIASTSTKSDRLYIVQEGDTLWKLSKRFNVDIEVLKSYNKLTSNTLTPNSALRIPLHEK